MSRILAAKKKTKRYLATRFRRGRLRGFEKACCELQTRRPEKKATNRTANPRSYIPYRVTPRTRVETKFKVVQCRRAACSTCLLCLLHLLHLHCLILFASHSFASLALHDSH